MHVRTRTWFSFVVAASVLFIIASRFAIFDPLESVTLSAVSPIEQGLRDGSRPIADFVNNLTDINRLSGENQSLREENERLLAENARLSESEIELRDLQQFVNVRGARPNDAFVGADVIAGDSSNQKDQISINRGSDHGVKEGMIVLTKQGSLVGSISKIYGGTAWVTLITDQTSAISGFVQSSRVQGVVAGSVDGSLTMEFVQETADIKEGDLVLTSGVGGGYPADELIGEVVNIERSAQELFQSVRVRPLADLSQLESVLVLSSFLPQQAVGP
jgi:rod shape-determining protein MreC